MPRHLEVDGANVDIYRAPGARAATFLQDRRLTPVLRKEYDLVLLWLGSNDITQSCRPREIINHIQAVVERIKTDCRSKVGLCLIEPRRVEHYRRPRPEQKDYNKVAKAINTRLVGRVYKGGIFVHFNPRFFHENLGRDGVHFNPEGRGEIARKIEACVTHHVRKWQAIQARGEPLTGQ